MIICVGKSNLLKDNVVNSFSNFNILSTHFLKKTSIYSFKKGNECQCGSNHDRFHEHLLSHRRAKHHQYC
jgi:hypothetical protein